MKPSPQPVCAVEARDPGPVWAGSLGFVAGQAPDLWGDWGALLGGMALVLVVSVLVFVRRTLTTREATEALLQQQREELRAVAGELVRVEQQMRQEIAGELHDHIAQNLAATMIRLELLKKNPLPDHSEASLAVAIGLLRECIRSTSDMTRRLAHPSLKHLGLVHALESLVAEYHEKHSIGFEFRDHGAIRPIDGDVADTVYRGVGELLRKIVADGAAAHVAVMLTQRDATLAIEVVEERSVSGAQRSADEERRGDAGTDSGLARREDADGIGLTSLRERVRQCGGELGIRSELRGGRSVTIVVPSLESEATESS